MKTIKITKMHLRVQFSDLISHLYSASNNYDSDVVVVVVV